MAGISNVDLVFRCISGDKNAWDKFVRRFSPLIFWAIRKRLNQANHPYSQQDLEDIFASVFLFARCNFLPTFGT